MRKLSLVIATAALAVAGAGAGVGTANAAPNSFVEMTEAWNGNTEVVLWWNTSNGGIHAQIIDNTTNHELDVKITDVNGNSLISAFTQGPGMVNTGEVHTAQSIKGCGKSTVWFCTGNT